MAANTNTLKLNPQTLYCVKSGLPLVAFASNAKSDMQSKALQTLNGMLSGGQLLAGVSQGRIFIEDETLKGHCAAHKMHVPKRMFWGGRRRDGQWQAGPGQMHGAHNIAVLKAFGFSADPKTLTKGTVGNRQYGVFAEPEAKPAPVMQDSPAPMLGSPAMAAPQPTAKPAPKPAIAQGECPMPSPEEMKGTGSYGRYVRIRVAAGFSREDANAAWRKAKLERASGSQPKPATVMPTPPKAESIEHVTIAKRKPKATSNAEPKATTIKVPASALKALLASVSDAEIKSYDAATNTFVVVS